MLTLRGLRAKVERAHVRADICQLEEESSQFQACAREGFESWVADAVALDEPVNVNELWEEIVKIVNTDGLRARVRELEDNLGSLLPLAERARGGEHGSDGGEDNVLWKRVIRQAKDEGSSLVRQDSRAAERR